MLRDTGHSASDKAETLLAIGDVNDSLYALLDRAEAIGAPLAVWRVLARVANQLAWAGSWDALEVTAERIQAGLSGSLPADDGMPVFSVWGWDERTEPGRHCYIYHQAMDYLVSRSLPVPGRLSAALTESLFAWEGDLVEHHPSILALHAIDPRSPDEDLPISATNPTGQLPACAYFDEADESVLRNMSAWNAMSARREQLLTLRMAANHIRDTGGSVPAELVRRLCAAAKDPR
jgi:hypothetical protein